MASVTIPLLEETAPFGDDDINHTEMTTKTFLHPFVTLSHVLFRSAAILSYLFCGWFSDSFITSFVFVILLLSADFWTVKNVTGRLLVGLRWWNYVDDNGVSRWIFESKKKQDSSRLNNFEGRIFWITLVMCPTLWSLFFIVGLLGFKFKWLLLVVIALILNGANLYGYIKCNFGATANIRTTTTDFVKSQVLKNAVNLISASSKNDVVVNVESNKSSNIKSLSMI
uniref:Golgi apparatus membrane protein TVP23 homolog n=1 Tax=Anopheles farauti TaxID=69004 RepID=A0A182QI94_9DIPT